MMNFEKKKPGDTINVFSWNALLEEIEKIKKQRDWLLHNNSVIPHLDCAITTEDELLAAMKSDEKCEACQGHGVVDQRSGNVTLNAIITCKECNGTGKKKPMLKSTISDAKIGRVNIGEYPLVMEKPKIKEESPCDACGNAGNRRGRLFCNFGGYLDHFKAPKYSCDGVEHFKPKDSSKSNEN